MVHTGGPPCPGRPSLPDRGQWPSPVTCTNLCPGVPAWRCRSHLRGWPVSRILFRGLPPFDDHSSSPALADGIQLPTRASRAEASLRRYRLPDLPRARPLFGIAPGGACLAASVASRAVGSYPTVSPLPRKIGAVSSLWRFPSGYPGRALPGTLASWSPDFPHGGLRPPAVIRPSARGQPIGPACAAVNHPD